MFRTYSAIALIFLTGCGGSGGTTNITDGPQQTSLATFTDGFSVVRRVDTGGSLASAATVNTVSTARVPTTDIPEDDPFKIEVSDLTLLTTTANGKVYNGNVTLNGDVYSVRMFTEDNSSTQLISALNTADSKKWTIVSGDAPSNLPSGIATYTGQNLISNTDNTNAGGGSFTMSVDFSNNSGSLTATSTTASSSLSGNFNINPSTGYFSGNNLTLNAPALAGGTSNAIIYGSFHGNGATGVSGLYYDDAAAPLVNGAIIGTKQ